MMSGRSNHSLAATHVCKWIMIQSYRHHGGKKKCRGYWNRVRTVLRRRKAICLLRSTILPPYIKQMLWDAFFFSPLHWCSRGRTSHYKDVADWQTVQLGPQAMKRWRVAVQTGNVGQRGAGLRRRFTRLIAAEKRSWSKQAKFRNGWNREEHFGEEEQRGPNVSADLVRKSEVRLAVKSLR